MTHRHDHTDEKLWNSLKSATDSERAEILQILGWRHIRQQKWARAVALLEEAKDAYLRLGLESQMRECANWIGRCLGNLGENERAILAHKEVLASLIDNDPTNDWVGKTLDAIGCQYRDAGMHDLAEPWFGQAARQHDANGDAELAVNSARKWINSIAATRQWSSMAEAASIVLRNSDTIIDHIRAHVGTVHAACAGVAEEVDVVVLLAKCDRLVSACDDVESAFEVELAHVAAMRQRGDLAGASDRALKGRAAAREYDSADYQAEFLLQAAACLADVEPERAESFLLVAKDLGEVLGDTSIEDRAEASLMQVREHMRSAHDELTGSQQSLW